MANKNNISLKKPVVPTLNAQKLEEFENGLAEILQTTIEASQFAEAALRPIEREEKIGFKEVVIAATRPAQINDALLSMK